MSKQESNLWRGARSVFLIIGTVVAVTVLTVSLRTYSENSCPPHQIMLVTEDTFEPEPEPVEVVQLDDVNEMLLYMEQTDRDELLRAIPPDDRMLFDAAEKSKPKGIDISWKNRGEAWQSILTDRALKHVWETPPQETMLDQANQLQAIDDRLIRLEFKLNTVN